MQNSILRAAILAALAMMGQQVSAHTATLYFDYVATNVDSGKGGNIADGTKGQYKEVAILTITDLADLNVAGGTSADGKRTYNNGGVRITLENTHSTDIFGRTPTSATALGSLEVNFPNTAETTTDFNNNYANWGNNSGVKIAYSSNPDDGGVEWQEDGCATTAISGGCTTAENSALTQWKGWGQQFNYGGSNGTNVDNANAVIAFAQGQKSTFDVYNPANEKNISVLKLLGNPVVPTGNKVQTLAFGWINAISGLPASADPNNRAVAASGWWGNSVNSGLTTSTNNRIQVLATHYSFNGAPATNTSPYAECLFNAVENDSRYNGFLKSKSATGVYQEYDYRYYPQTKVYLGVSRKDSHIYYLDAAGKMWDLTQSFGWDYQGKLAEYNCR